MKRPEPVRLPHVIFRRGSPSESIAKRVSAYLLDLELYADSLERQLAEPPSASRPDPEPTPDTSREGEALYPGDIVEYEGENDYLRGRQFRVSATWGGPGWRMVGLEGGPPVAAHTVRRIQQ